MVITTKIYNMRNIKLLALLLVLVVGSTGSLYAQYDDLYYDPAKDKGFFADYKPDSRDYSRQDNYAYNDDYYQDDYYDDEGYEYYNDYDYHYTSRIRRFHNPYYGFSFFDPVYLDMAYYDPFFSPGMTVLIYDDVFAFNNWYRFNRWNRWNSWGPSWGWNSWNGVNINFNFGFGRGWNAWDPWGWNSWNRWNRWNSWGPSWGFNNFYVNNFYGYGGGFYCPPTWGGGYVYNTVNEIRSNTVYGPRMNGTTKTPELNSRDIRRETPKDVTNAFPRNSTDGVTLPNDRIQPNDPNNPEREVTGREKAHTERFSIFDEKEKTDYGRTIDAIRDGRMSDLNRNDRTRTNPNDRIDRRWDRNDRTRSTSPRSYDPNSRTRTRDIEMPRTRSYEPTRRSTPPNNTRSNEIRRNNNNTRSSSPSMNNTRSSSPTRSQMGSSRSSGSNTRSSGSTGSSRSGSSSSSSSRRGGNN